MRSRRERSRFPATPLGKRRRLHTPPIESEEEESRASAVAKQVIAEAEALICERGAPSAERGRGGAGGTFCPKGAVPRSRPLSPPFPEVYVPGEDWRYALGEFPGLVDSLSAFCVCPGESGPSEVPLRD